jgi:hypothetical protein
MTTYSQVIRNHQSETTSSNVPARRQALSASVIALALFAFSLLLSGFSSTAAAQCTGTNLVTNGDFETGNLTGWTVAWPSDPYLYVAATSPAAGRYSAWFGAVPGENRISQKVSTTVGKLYTVCFTLANGASCCASAFHGRWNGNDMVSMVNPGGFAYTQYSFQVFANGNDVLSFEARQVPSFFRLDDVKVVLGGYSFTPSLDHTGSKATD